VRMQPAGDAVLIDTTDLEVDDVVERIEELVRARSGVTS
jgi:cytidylate kinase